MKFWVRDFWPSELDLDPDIADAVFDRDRIAKALGKLQAEGTADQERPPPPE